MFFKKLADLCKRKSKSAFNYVITFAKWVIIAAFTGLIGGFIGSLFSICLKIANRLNSGIWWLVFLLPVVGVVIVFLYKLCKLQNDPGTNCVIDSIRSKEKVPWAMAPLIFISTTLTHLAGGSAGREGAALQLGGSLGSVVGRVLHLDEKDMHIAVLCGMSGVFSSLFCTPVTAAIFALEVISVGITYYSALLPCLVSATVSYFLAVFMGIEPTRFNIAGALPEISFNSLALVVGLAAACAVVSIIFCVAMRKMPLLLKKLIKNDYLRVIAGGVILIALTFAVGCHDYNGAGSHIIAEAIGGTAKPEAFLLKILFTSITIGSGFKGGEIVPSFFLGATFGCTLGNLLGLSPMLCAAAGMAGVFCGVTNSPMTALFISFELFGLDGIFYYLIMVSICYMLSGYFGLYKSQKIMYSKSEPTYINRGSD